jgi:nicotinamidase-related amidase
MNAPKANVLLIVDVQKGFVTPHSAHVLAPLERLQHAFRHVVFTKFHNPDPSPFRDILYYDKLPPGSAETELAIRPRSDAVIIDRPLYTCLTEDLQEHLRAWRATEVCIGGIATEACVLKSVTDLFEHNITPWVLEDLCASDKDRHFHDYAIEIIGKLIDPGHIIQSSDIGKSGQ